ncbi:MAG: hypothetical protein RLZZ546_1288 [Bacteroidota bacterium]|jgi:Mn2+/Fe2+ NRAMP family transporter
MKFGPGLVITSAFIGPGTVTLCLLAGVASGNTLLWAVVFSTIATIILQDMCVRLGFYTKMGLEENIKLKMEDNAFLPIISALIFVAIIFGNTAYQSGNIAGTAMGIELITGNVISRSIVIVIIYIFCVLSILFLNYNKIKDLLSLLVFAMSFTFVTLALLYFPSIKDFLKGCFIPVFQSKDVLLIMGLIGTTVVPYNLFLHTSLVSKQNELDLQEIRKDSFWAIIIGGVISMAIVIIGSKGQGMNIETTADMAAILKNTTKNYSNILLGLGLFAAGLTSALTAPIAAGFVAAGLLGWSKDLNYIKTKGVVLFVLTIGFLVTLLNVRNIEIIKTAQVINGVLLPIFAIFLLLVLNDRRVIKVHMNTTLQNILGVFILFITIILAYKSILSLF